MSEIGPKKIRNARKLIRGSNETYSFVLGEFKDFRRGSNFKLVVSKI